MHIISYIVQSHRSQSTLRGQRKYSRIGRNFGLAIRGVILGRRSFARCASYMVFSTDRGRNRLVDRVSYLPPGVVRRGMG